MRKQLKLTVPIYYTFEYKTKKPKTVLNGLNHYRNCHYHSLNKIKKYYHDLIGEMVDGIQLQTPLRSQNMLYIKRKGSDGHNIAPIILKYVYDALQEHGVIPDDNTDHVVSDSTEYVINKNNPRMEIVLYSV